MVTEAIDVDMYGRGYVIRIFAMCDESEKADFPEDGIGWKDAFRTEFDTPKYVVEQWNNLTTKGHIWPTKDHGENFRLRREYQDSIYEYTCDECDVQESHSDMVSYCGKCGKKMRRF